MLLYCLNLVWTCPLPPKSFQEILSMVENTHLTAKKFFITPPEKLPSPKLHPRLSKVSLLPRKSPNQSCNRPIQALFVTIVITVVTFFWLQPLCSFMACWFWLTHLSECCLQHEKSIQWSKFLPRKFPLLRSCYLKNPISLDASFPLLSFPFAIQNL